MDDISACVWCNNDLLHALKSGAGELVTLVAEGGCNRCFSAESDGRTSCQRTQAVLEWRRG